MKFCLRLILKRALAVAAAALTVPAFGQDILGHEYEFDAAPIREGEQPVIP